MKNLLFPFLFTVFATTFQAQVSISPTNTQPAASAMLDVQSTNKGMLVPRMTTAQRTAIPNPAKGLMVFDNTTNSFWFHNGTAWAAVGGSDVPSSGIVLSETMVNQNLTNAGFSLLGKTQMVLTGTSNSNNFAWTGETSLVGAPSPRQGHSAIWTGTEMIVWGGFPATNTGGKYNPSTDTWTSTSTTNTPVGISGHTTIWTGTEMIVWGGGYPSQTNTGAKYNPTSNIWTAISTVNAPSARNGHTAVWTGTEMIVWGGGFPNPTNTGAKYNPTTDTWTQISVTNAPSARRSHVSVWTGTEMIIWGDGGNPGTNTGGRYNPINDTWTETNLSGAPSPPSEPQAIWTGTEMIVRSNPNPDNEYYKRYNPISNQWFDVTYFGNFYGATISWTGNQMIVGGGFGTYYEIMETQIYFPATDSWSRVSSSNNFLSRTYHSSVWTGNSLIVWGGGYPTGGAFNDGNILSPAELKPLYLFIKN